MKLPTYIKGIVFGFLAATVLNSSAKRMEEVTLLMVPREDATVQLGLDIANKYPTLLVSYKLGVDGAISLHGWTGTQWVNITTENFRDGNFFKTGPDSALLIEAPGTRIPANLVPPEEWCTSVSKITTIEMRPLIHLCGQYFDFSFKDWQWFAKRYNMDLDAINPEGLNVAWYNKPLSEHFKEPSPVGASDLQYWFSIRQPVVATPLAEEPVVAAAEEPPVIMETEPVVDEAVENPLTNDVPVAMVMGAADAPEEVSAETEAVPPQDNAKMGEEGL